MHVPLSRFYNSRIQGEDFAPSPPVDVGSKAKVLLFSECFCCSYCVDVCKVIVLLYCSTRFEIISLGKRGLVVLL